MRAYPRRVDAHSDVHPLLCVSDSHLQGFGVGVVETLNRADGNVHGAHFCLLQNPLKTIEIVRLQRCEVAAMRLNVMNVKFRDDMSWKFEEVHSGKAAIAVAIVRANDVRAKWVRRDGDALAGVGGKRNMWFGTGTCQSAGQGSRRDPASTQNREVFQERASS